MDPSWPYDDTFSWFNGPEIIQTIAAMPTSQINASTPLPGILDRCPRLRRGKLKGMRDLPEDLLRQIFQFLLPLDILNLSRTSKELRRSMMLQSSLSIWQQARYNVTGLPACPNDMSEPAYASLVFDKHCQLCTSGRVRGATYWNTRVRCCTRCLPQLFIKPRAMSKECPGLTPKIVDCIPRIYGGGCTWYYLPAVKKYDEEYKQLKAGDKALVKQWEDDIAARQRVADQFQRALERYIQGVETYNSQRLHPHVIQRLLDEGKSNSVAPHTQIFSLLQFAPGWVNILRDPRVSGGILESVILGDPKGLTDKAWSKLRPALHNFLRTQCDLKLQEMIRDVKDFYYERNKTGKLQFINPPIADFATFPPVRAILKNLSVVTRRNDGIIYNMAILPGNSPVQIPDAPVEHLWVLLQGHFSQFETEWKRQKDEELLKLMQEGLGGQGGLSTDHLKLATTFFGCQVCRESIQYPRILAHRCLSQLSTEHIITSKHGDVIYTGPYTDEMFKMFIDFEEQPWNYRGNQVVFHTAAYEEARHVMASARLSPDKVSAAEMHDTYMFECTTCRTQTEWILMKFLPAVRHGLDHKSRGEHAVWRSLTPKEKQHASTYEVRAYREALMGWRNKDFTCIHCKYRGTLLEIFRHIKTEHRYRDVSCPTGAKTHPVQLEEFYLDLDSDFVTPAFAVRVE